MWIVGKGGNAVNIARADALFIDKNDCYVKAVFSGVGAILKKFDNEDDAKKYIADLVEKLNAEK